MLNGDDHNACQLDIHHGQVAEVYFSTGMHEDTCRNICKNLTSDILSRKSTFQEAIKSLHTYLTNSDLTKHNFGVNILADIVVFLPQDFLYAEEIEFIVIFFCNKIRYHYSFLPSVLKGLSSLARSTHISEESLINITTTLFNNVVWQSQTVTDRREFYSLLQYVVCYHLEDYRSSSSEFLFYVISTIDGEKDPRNLLLIFSFLSVLYSSISLGNVAEDAFESIACYFPIDFQCPVSENGLVKREDLVCGLNSCLLAVNDFAEFCVTLLLEKLQSNMKYAKIDCYMLLMEGSICWPPECIISHIQDIWSAIKLDCFSARDSQIANFSTQAFQLVVKAMTNISLNQLLEYLITCCDEVMCDIQMTMFEPAFCLLTAAMKASTTACRALYDKFLTRFLSLFERTEEESKVLVLNKIIIFLQISLDNLPTISEEQSWDGLTNVLWSHLEQSHLPEDQHGIYSIFILASKHLNCHFREKLYSTILFHVINHRTKLVRDCCIKCLQVLALEFEEEVEKRIVQNLEDLLKKNEDSTVKTNSFKAICSLALMKRFLQYFERAFFYLISHRENSIAAALSSVRSLLEEKDVQCNKEFVQYLFNKSKLLYAISNTPLDGENLENSARIVTILVSLQSSSDQESVINPLVQLILQPPFQNQQMTLLNSMVGSLHPDVNIITTEQIRQFILPMLLSSPDDIFFRKSCELLLSLVNKSLSDELLMLMDDNMKSFSPNQAVTVHSYITKALVLRRHPLVGKWLNKLINYLEDDKVAPLASEGFELILSKPETGLSHYNVILFSPQYLYQLLMPHLMYSNNNYQHLKVLGCLLNSVPSAVYVDELKEIMPLLIKCLDTGYEKLSLTVLSTLSSTICFEDHINTLIPRFLRLARISPFMKVRVEALQCLCHLINCSSVLLLPYKQQVIAELVHCLSDKKRLVRRMAAHTRSKWFLLGAPTKRT